MTLSEKFNCARADLHRAEAKLVRERSAENARAVELQKAKCDRLWYQIKASGPSVRDIQAEDGVLL